MSDQCSSDKFPFDECSFDEFSGRVLQYCMVSFASPAAKDSRFGLHFLAGSSMARFVVKRCPGVSGFVI